MGTFGQNSEILRALLGEHLSQSPNLGSSPTFKSGYGSLPTLPSGFLSGLAGLANSSTLPTPNLGSVLASLTPQFPSSYPSLQPAVDMLKPLPNPSINMGQGKPPLRPKKITDDNLQALERKLKLFKKVLDNPLRSRRLGSVHLAHSFYGYTHQ